MLIVCVCTILERLVDNVTTVGRADNVREASLEALGYICQDIVSSFIHSFIRVCVVVVVIIIIIIFFFSYNKNTFFLQKNSSRIPMYLYLKVMLY